MLRKILFNKWTITAAALVAIYTLAGFFLTPVLVRYGLENVVAEKLNTSIVIEKIQSNPYTFTLDIANFSMKDPKEGPLLEFAELFIDFETRSLVNWAWTFSEIRLVNPDIHLTMLPGYRLNVLDLLPESDTDSSKGPLILPRARFESVNLQNGRVIYADQTVATPFVIKLGPTNIDIKDLATLKEHNGQYNIAMRTEEGATITWQGQLSLNPISSKGKVEAREVKLATAFPFFADLLNLKEPAGTVDADTEYNFAYADGSLQLSLEKTGGEVTGLALTLPDQLVPFFTLGRASVEDVRFNLADQKIQIGALKAGNGSLKVHSDVRGVHDVETIWKSLLAESDQKTVTDSKTDEKPWYIQLDRLSVEKIVFTNLSDRFMLPVALRANVTDFGLQGSARIGNEMQIELTDIHGRIDNVGVQVDDQSELWASINEIVYRDGTFDLAKKAIIIDQVFLNKGNGRVWLDPEKQVNWLKTFAFREEQIAFNPLEIVKEAIREDQPWSMKINRVALDQFDARFTDNSVTPPAEFNLQNAKITLANVSNRLQKPIDFNIQLRVGRNGQLESSGDVIPNKAAVNAAVKVSGVDLTPVQPYVSAIVPLTIHSGIADLNGRLNTVSADQKINITYDGGVNVARVMIKETKTGNLFAGFQNLDIPVMKLSLAPDRIDIKSVNVKAPRGRVIINEDLSINVVELFNEQVSGNTSKPTEPSKTETPAAFPINVQRIRVSDGSLEFADLSLIPQFGTRIRELSGVINGLSTSPESRSAIQMKGRVDEYGETNIEGQLKPLQPTGFMNMRMNFRNLVMRNLSPYAVKFAGHEIKSGRLSLDLHYRMDQQKLYGDHRIVADRLVLGPKLKGKGQIDAPVDLAVALLKDPNGRIKLSVSVNGSLDDPNFNYGQLMGQGFGSVIGNIAKAPFAAIGKMVGAKNTKLDSIGFDPGKTLPPPHEAEKFKLLAEGLNKRPEIKLKIQSHYNTQIDGRYLRSLQVRREIARRMEFELAADEDPGDFDASNGDVQRVIEEMIAERYSPQVLNQIKEDYKKDRGALKASASPSAAADEDAGALHYKMFEYLVEKQPQDKGVLAQLGKDRGAVVVNQITANGKIDPDRLIILEPSDTAELRDGMVQTRLKIAGK